MPTWLTVKDRVLHLERELEWSARKMSRECGFDESGKGKSESQIEKLKNRENANMHTLRKIRDRMRVDLNWLICGGPQGPGAEFYELAAKERAERERVSKEISEISEPRRGSKKLKVHPKK